MKKDKKTNKKESIEEVKPIETGVIVEENELKVEKIITPTEESTEPDKKVKKSKKEKKQKKPKKSKKEKKDKEPKKTRKEKRAEKVKRPKKIKDRARWTKKYFKKYQGKEKNAFSKFVEQDLKHAILRAQKLSSIDTSIYKKPIIITIPDAFYNSSKVSFRLDRLADGKVTQIYDQALVTMLFFGEETLYYYQANIDHRNGRIAFDKAGEFNLFDVIHLETQLNYDHPEKHKYIMLDLKVGLSDGRVIEFHLRNHRLHKGYFMPEVLTDQEQKILDLFKSKVRQAKTL